MFAVVQVRRIKIAGLPQSRSYVLCCSSSFDEQTRAAALEQEAKDRQGSLIAGISDPGSSSSAAKKEDWRGTADIGDRTGGIDVTRRSLQANGHWVTVTEKVTDRN